MVIDETPQDPTGNCEIFMYEDNFCGNLREIFLTPNDEGVCHIFTATGNLLLVLDHSSHNVFHWGNANWMAAPQK